MKMNGVKRKSVVNVFFWKTVLKRKDSYDFTGRV